MAGQANPSNDSADAIVSDAAAVAAEAAPVVEAPRKFRVLHGAVSGIGRDKNGKNIDVDYALGAIVDEKQLDGNAPQYLVMGAIEPLE